MRGRTLAWWPVLLKLASIPHRMGLELNLGADAGELATGQQSLVTSFEQRKLDRRRADIHRQQGLMAIGGLGHDTS